MIVSVNNIIEQRVVVKAYCLEKGIDPNTIPTHMKCQFVIATPGGLVTTNDLGEVCEYSKKLNETCITFSAFVNDVLIPKYAEALDNLAKHKATARKYQDNLRRIQSMFTVQ